MIFYIVLHYMDYDSTIMCVDSVLKAKKEVDHIVIVDNGSTNNSAQRLSDHYLYKKEIVILRNDKNVGFANGNNVGYQYALYNKADYIVCLNNDVELPPAFSDYIISEYIKEPFSVLGPDIFSTKRHLHQSPSKKAALTKNQLLTKLLLWKIAFYLPFLVILKRCFSIEKNATGWMHEHHDIPLQGACVIFSKDYFKRRTYAFNPDTFMYLEMEILCYECNKLDLKQRYSPSVTVFHHEDCSTDYVFKNEIKKIHFKCFNSINSGKVLLKIMKDDY